MKNLLLITALALVLVLALACAPTTTNVQPTVQSAAETAAAGANQAATQVAAAANQAATAAAGAGTSVAGAATQVSGAVATAVPQATATPPPPNCEPMAGVTAPAAGELGSPDNPVVIALVPSGDVPTITQAGTEIADCLSKLTGMTYNIEVGTNFAASIEAMGAGKAPFGFLNTFSAILANEKYGVTPKLVALRNYKGKPENFYQGQFIASKASGITQIADLKGKNFCFVDPNSTSGYIIPRIVLAANGVNPDTDITTTNAGSHDNVAIAVYKGDCDAGATFVDVRTDSTPIKTNYPDMVDKVDAFYITENIPNDGLQVAADVDPALTKATVDGLLFMANDPGGKALLRRMYSYVGLVEVPEDFYADFEALLEKAGVSAEDLVQ